MRCAPWIWILFGHRAAIETLAPRASTFWTGMMLVLITAIAISPQRELANNAAVERAVATGQYREALNFLSSHQPADFAPARALPPKPFEVAIFSDLPRLFAELRPDDAPWVRALLLRRLDQMLTHYDLRWNSRGRNNPGENTNSVGNQADELVRNILRQDNQNDFAMLGTNLARIPAGAQWLNTNLVFVEALRRIAQSNATAANVSPR